MRTIAERFQAKVKVMHSDCHEWIGCCLYNGYGQFHLGGKTAYAHRVAYELAHGPITDGLHVLHSCDNRKCVNPLHLSLGTRDDNALDMVIKKRQAHGSKNGHAKLTEQQVREIRKSTAKQNDLALKYGVTQSRISMLMNGHGWQYA